MKESDERLLKQGRMHGGVTRSLQLSQIGKVVRPADGAFVLNQLFLAEYEYRNAVEVSGDFAGEGLLARHSGKAGQQVDAIWRAPELNDLVAYGEINWREF